MKYLEDKTQVKHDLKSLGIIALLLIFHFGSYFFAKVFVDDPLILNNEIEDQIPQVQDINIFSNLCNFIYSSDIQQNSTENIPYAIVANVMPSGHTIASLLFVYCCVCYKEVSTRTTIVIAVISTLIIASTIFIKQHVHRFSCRRGFGYCCIYCC